MIRAAWAILTLATIAARGAAQQPPFDPGMVGPSGQGPGACAPAPWSGQQVVPGAPVQPVPTARPASWPAIQVPVYAPPAPAQPARADLELCEGARILARVGPEAILASEVSAGIDEVVEKNRGRIPDAELERQRELLIRQKLRQHIETKLIYLDAKQTIPAENFPNVEKNIGEFFEKEELKNLMKRGQVATRQELDQKLRQLGTSLEREKKAFLQRTLAQQWARQQVKSDQEVTFDQMLDYYRDHPDEFERPARVRWKELMARFSKYATKAEAGAAIAAMGNQVAAGVPLEQVAKAKSDGSTAPDGGTWGWTTKGSLVSEVLDRALFDPNLPPSQLSPILESPQGFHIVLVSEREDAHRVPFLEAQVEIEPKIKRQRLEEQLLAYVTRLREKIPVWTIYGNEDEEPAAQVSGRQRQGPY